MEKLHRFLHPQIKIISESAGLCDYTVSDESIDSYNEVVVAAGFDPSRLEKNAPVVDSHDYSSVAKCVGRLTDWHLEGRSVVQRVQWAVDVKENELAQLGWKMTVAGYLKAVSVGFFPVSFLTPNSGQEWKDALKALGLEDGADVRTIYTAWQQVELSVCILGANPNALARAHADGVIKSGDLERFPALVQRMPKGRVSAFSFAPSPALPSNPAPATKSDNRKDFMNKFNLLLNKSGVTSPKNAFDAVEMIRRDGTDDEIHHAVRQASLAVTMERRTGGPDAIERFLDQPGVREFFNALARALAGKGWPKDFEPVGKGLEKWSREFGLKFKDLDVTPSGTGAAFFLPQALSDQIFDLLPLYGAYNFLGVRKLPKMFTKFANVTGQPSAVFINATQGNVTIPKDASFAGASMLPEANVVATLIPVSYQLWEDAGLDLAAVLARYIIMGLAARIDYGCFQGNGIVDAGGLNGGITGIMQDATVNSSVAAVGNTTVEQLARPDFCNVLATINPAALQRLCRWFINPGYLPFLLKISDANGANWLLKTPAETSDGTWSLVGFPVVWASQMPANPNVPGNTFAAFLNPDSYLVAMADEFAIGASDSPGWNVLQKYYRGYGRVWAQTRQSNGIVTLTTAAH